jgi:hypothetical protein
VFRSSFVEVCVTLHWLLDCSKLIVKNHACIECDCGDCGDFLARQCCSIETVLLIFLFGSLYLLVSVDNRLGAEGANALGDGLKGNTTLTSLRLTLQGEWFLFKSVQNSAPISLEVLTNSLFHISSRERHRRAGVC